MFFFISGNEQHYTYVTMAMHLEMVLTIYQGTGCHETIQRAIIKVNCTTSDVVTVENIRHSCHKNSSPSVKQHAHCLI